MTEMIGRVAWALSNALANMHRSNPDAMPDSGDLYLEMAEAAIQEMREPTAEMLEAMHRNVPRGRAPSHMDEWHAAIDEALK